MARTKDDKKVIIDKISTIMDGAKTLVFVNFHGLKVADATAMRREFKKNGVGYFVAKKTLTEKALEKKKYEGEVPVLVGEFGFAYSEDLIAPARLVYEFEKKLNNQVSIVGGVFDGKYMSKEEMTGIATIPPIETLYGMFVNVINSPIQGLVMALDQISKTKKD
ncbi:MAG: 50S ribosomal protein L10 [Patescibacteria group bacterium]|nr:50S ribosomal protein L10 [Patescibacteria group bacterium]